MALIGFCIWYLFYRIFIICLGMIRPYFAQPSWCHWCEAALKISPNPNLICQIKIWSVSGEWNTIIKSTLFRSGQHSTILIWIVQSAWQLQRSPQSLGYTSKQICSAFSSTGPYRTSWRTASNSPTHCSFFRFWRAPSEQSIQFLPSDVTV